MTRDFSQFFYYDESGDLITCSEKCAHADAFDELLMPVGAINNKLVSIRFDDDHTTACVIDNNDQLLQKFVYMSTKCMRHIYHDTDAVISVISASDFLESYVNGFTRNGVIYTRVNQSSVALDYVNLLLPDIDESKQLFKEYKVNSCSELQKKLYSYETNLPENPNLRDMAELRRKIRTTDDYGIFSAASAVRHLAILCGFDKLQGTTEEKQNLRNRIEFLCKAGGKFGVHICYAFEYINMEDGVGIDEDTIFITLHDDRHMTLHGRNNVVRCSLPASTSSLYN